ncbi:MAG: protein kinase [Limisphaerales bacterium]
MSAPSDGPPRLPRQAVPPPLPRHAVADSQREPAAPPADLVAHLEERGYKVFEQIGAGGFAHVYKGYDERHQRFVALKVLRHDADPVAAQRFRAESVLLAKCNHSNIVRIYDSGEHEGSPYLVVELVASRAGRSSPRTLTELKETPEGWARLFATLARALQTAHEAKLTHRDLKPENILLRGETAEPVIVDFGMARDANRLIDGNVTRNLAGTPSYMAPEQILEARRKQVGPATDQWALGVLLYEVLTGRRPFDVSREDHEILAAICNPEFEPVPLRHLVPTLPRALEAICLKCLQRDPDFRYASMASLANDLELFLSIGQSLAEAEVLTPTRRALRKTTLLIRRHWVATAAVTVLAGFGLLLFAGFLLGGRKVKEYYKDYTLKWGVPHGITRIQEADVKRRERSYLIIREGYVGKVLALHRISSQLTAAGEFTVVDDEDEIGAATIEVRYADKPGGGKVVRELCYLNDRTNEVLKRHYQDDELRSVSFTRRAAGDRFATHPAVLRELLPLFMSHPTGLRVAYDHRGFELTNLFVDVLGQPVLDREGNGGVAWKVDEAGRKVEQWWLGTNAQPAARSFGIAREVRKYDPTGDLVEKAKFEHDGALLLRTRTQYDKWGNWTATSFLEPAVEPANGATGVSSIGCVRDQAGRKAELTHFGIHGTPVSDEDGVARTTYEYDGGWRVRKTSYFDFDGQSFRPMPGVAAEISGYDERGQLVELSMLDAEGKLVLGRKGFARVRWKLDPAGRVIEQHALGVTGERVLSAEGFASVSLEHDQWGLTSMRCFGVRGEPVEVAGYHRLNVRRNVRGRIEEAAGFSWDGKPVSGPWGCLRTALSYHENGSTSQIQRDLMVAEEGAESRKWVREEARYNPSGHETTHSFFDAQNRPTLGLRIESAQAQPLRPSPAGAGRPDAEFVASKRGYAVRQSYYDEQQRLTEVRYLGTNLAPVVSVEGFASIKVSYEQPGTSSTRYFGADGQPIAVGGCFRLDAKRDAEGRIVERALFDQHDNPARSEFGFNRLVVSYHPNGEASRKQSDWLVPDADGGGLTPVTQVIEFDNVGFETRRAFLDHKQSPTLCSIEPVGESAPRSSPAASAGSGAASESKDQIVRSRRGFAVREYRYDDEHRLVEERFLGTNLVPIRPAAYGYAKLTHSYGVGDQVQRTECFDEQGRELPQAARIMEVRAGSLAEGVGLQVGDIVLSLGGHTVSADAPLGKLVGERPVPAELTVKRGTARLRFSLERPGPLGVRFEPVSQLVE